MTKKPAKASSRAVTTKTGTAVAVAQPSPPATFLEYLDRASRDKDFDAAKFKIIIEAKERQDDRAKEDAFDEAMANAQQAMAPIRADMENKQTKSRYASDVALDKAIRPIYSRFGFALSFGTGDNPPADHVRVTCRVSCAGHRRVEHFDIPADGKGAKGGDVMTKTHAAGSAASYGRRYLLMMIFNLTVIKKAGEPFADDDGNGAAGLQTDNSPVTPKQLDKITSMLLETKSNVPIFLDMLSKIHGAVIESPSDIPASLYDQAIAKLEQKRGMMMATK